MNNIQKIVADKLSCVRQGNLLFENISFSLTAGDVLLVEGANGSGKSSLLRLLSGLASPYSGKVYWQDKLIQNIPAEYGEHLHFVGHTNGIKLGLTVLENLQLAHELSSSGITSFDDTLSLLQLSAHKHTLAKNLSAGQKRRIALATLFTLEKSLWLLDEPFTALDVNTQTIFLLKLEEHLQRGGITIISSHHPIHLENRVTQIVRLGTS